MIQLFNLHFLFAELPSESTSWQWQGNFNYAEMDKAIATYIDCVGKAMEADCNSQLFDKVRTCTSA